MTGQNHPSGGPGPVVIFAPPVAVQAPPVAVQAPATVITATSPAVASEPCNCLTKQYLDDGSVLFKDICTKEAAMATPAELKAQALSVAPAVQ